VAFNLVPGFLNAGARHFGFVLRGLRELAAAAAQQGIPFFLLQVSRVLSVGVHLGTGLLGVQQ
jgi:deoxyribodipyrimidine photo-lyase